MSNHFRHILIVLAALAAAGAPRVALSQTNVLARYADGQVWVVWREDPSPPTTYAIYAKATPFTSTNQATLIGRLFREEWLPLMIATQTSGAVDRWRIPDGVGGRDTLDADRGLFVQTPAGSGTLWYAVVAYGDTTVTAANRSSPVSFTASLADPPECHLQHEYTDGPWLISVYSMWADGREFHWAGRPDFPVMANAHKNGMPSLFMLSRPLALPPGPRPLVHWFHGGGGTAGQSQPGDRPAVNIDPVDGFLCAHNDDFIRYMSGAGILTKQSNSWFFGWTKHHDPFDSTLTTPAPDDTVINYTQRRLVWINDWLGRNFPVDMARVAGQGHSMGSAGVTALGKAYPSLFSTISMFNNGFGGPDGLDEELPNADVSQGHNLFGTPAMNLPTILRRANNDVVHAFDLWNLTTPLSPERDLPLFRSLHGKHDDNGTMSWDAYVVEQYRSADSLGLGMHLYWDERRHGLGAIPSYFCNGDADSQQTGRDDVADQGRYRNNVSYPAFFNHRIYPDSRDPGDGTGGTTPDSTWSGDDWGTWGGFHDWEPDSIVDETARWECPIWLIDQSVSLPDNCPFESLTCDVAIRRPQSFLPLPGTSVYWCVTEVTGDTVQAGLSIVRGDGLVTAPGITATRYPETRWLRFTTLFPAGAPDAAPGDESAPALVLSGSSTSGNVEIGFRLPEAQSVRLTVHDLQGRRVGNLADGEFPSGWHSVRWSAAGIASGVYWVRLATRASTLARRVIVAR